MGAKSRTRRTETPKPILIKFCMVVDIPDVVAYTNFGDHRLRGFGWRGVKFPPLPLTFIVALIALSPYRESVWYRSTFGYDDAACSWSYDKTKMHVFFENFARWSTEMDKGQFFFTQPNPTSQFTDPTPRGSSPTHHTNTWTNPTSTPTAKQIEHR